MFMIHKNPVIFSPASRKSRAFWVTNRCPFSGMILHNKHCRRKPSMTCRVKCTLAQETKATAPLGFQHVGMTGALHCGPPNEALV